MADGLKGIITQLEQQKSAIERAVSALREVDGVAGPGTPPASAPTQASRKGAMTPEGRARLVAALKRRWAAKKAATGKRGRSKSA